MARIMQFVMAHSEQRSIPLIWRQIGLPEAQTYMNRAWASCKGPHCADPVMSQNSVSTSGPSMGGQNRAWTVFPQLPQTWVPSTGPE